MTEEDKTVLVVEDDAVAGWLVSCALESAGIKTVSVADGIEALTLIRQRPFSLVLLDLELPGMHGLDILERINREAIFLKVIVMTGDDTPETVLGAITRQAYRYILKPFSMMTLVELVQNALSTPLPSVPIEVISARPEWVELLVPCDLDSAERIRSFLASLEANLPEKVRESISQAFRELLLNAIEWGGKFDPNHKVRISCLRARRMVLYRIADPGSGFQMENLEHTALGNPEGDPLHHMQVREGLKMRPGGYGILLVKSIVDELLFNEARNEVVFIKYLD